MTLLPDWFQSETWALISGSWSIRRLDLGGSEDRRVGREAIDLDLPVVGRVHPCRDPGDHVRPPGRDHRLEQEEFDAILVGQPHLDVVRLRRQGLLARLDRHRPQVVGAEELLGVRDVVAPEHGGLDVEQVFRDAEVGGEVGRHRRDRFEQRGEDALVGADDRIRRVVDVEVHRAVVGVDRDLDAVADVVEVVVLEPCQVEAVGATNR